MDRILALSLVGAGTGNVFGPGMSAGALESFFARDAGRASRGAAAAGGGKRSASAGSGGTCAAADRTGEKKAANNSGASADVTVTRCCPALDLDYQRFGLDAVVAPY